MFFRCFVGLAVYSTFLLQPGCAGQRRVMKASPSWARDAQWYHVVVPRFHNGDRSNDPPNTQPWTVDWLAGGDPIATGEETAAEVKETDLDARHYGGDLQGLQARLPFL